MRFGISLFIILYLPSAIAITHAELCTFDTLCSRTVNQDGSVKRPKPVLVETLKLFRSVIREAAHEMGVDSRAIAGAIAAENTMNVQVDQTSFDFIQKIKATQALHSLSKLLRGKSMSIGLGQITLEAATEGESVLAKIEKRPIRTDREVNEALLQWDSSVRYAAAIIRFCQDIYKEHGFDVSQDPAVLTSLFNLGGCRKRASEAKASGKIPKPNYFGFFVQENLTALSDITEFNRPYEGKDKEAARAEAEMKMNSNYQPELVRPVELFNQPPSCTLYEGGGGPVEEYIRLSSLRVSAAHAKASGVYSTLSQGIDCDLKEWSLIRTQDGKIGWAKTSTLAENMRPKKASKQSETCKNENADCMEQVQAVSPPGWGMVGQEFEMQFAKMANTTEIPQFEAEHVQRCLSTFADMYRPKTSTEPELPVYTVDQLKKLVAQIAEKQNQIAKVLGYGTWSNIVNPMRDFTIFINKPEDFPNGLRVNPKAIDAFLTARAQDFRGSAGIRKIQELRIEYSYYYPPTEQRKALTHQERIDILRQTLDEADKVCDFDTPELKAHILTIRGQIQKIEKDDEKKYRVTHKFPDEVMESSLQNNLPALCRAIKKVETEEDKTRFPPETSCVLPYSNQGRITTSYITKAAMQELAANDEDRRNILEYALKSFEELMPTIDRNEDANRCAYSPFGTAESLDKILNLPCVEAAFVPDKFLIQKLKQHHGKVFYKIFEENNRMSIRFKSNCQEQNGSPWFWPFGL